MGYDVSCLDCGQYSVENRKRNPNQCPRCGRKDAVVLYHKTELDKMAECVAREQREEGYQRQTTPEVKVHERKK